MRFVAVALVAFAFPLAAAAKSGGGFDLAVKVNGGTVTYHTSNQLSSQYMVNAGGVDIFDTGPKRSAKTTATFVLSFSSSQIKKVVIFASGRGCTSASGGTVMTCPVLPIDTGTILEYGIAYAVGHNTHLQGSITVHATVTCLKADRSCKNNKAAGTFSLKPAP